MIQVFEMAPFQSEPEYREAIRQRFPLEEDQTLVRLVHLAELALQVFWKHDCRNEHARYFFHRIKVAHQL
jgi:hypothetical protein